MNKFLLCDYCNKIGEITKIIPYGLDKTKLMCFSCNNKEMQSILKNLLDNTKSHYVR